MKPILLHGHERSLTMIKYNTQGDLLFSCSKDSKPSVWYSSNGERVGTYNGHQGAVWCLDIDNDTSQLVTGCADDSAKIWDCSTGKQLYHMDTPTGVRTCCFSSNKNTLVLSTDANRNKPSYLMFYDLRDSSQMKGNKPGMTLQGGTKDNKVTAAVWSPNDETFLTGHSNGTITAWDPKTGSEVTRQKCHEEAINNMQPSMDRTMFISASRDHTAKLWDCRSLKHQKTYKTEHPVNSAAISPLRDHIILGGGQDHDKVTQTDSRAGKFVVRFYHLVFEQEIGRVKGHFGPINTVAFHPSGRSFASGGEDGYIRLHTFNDDYFRFEFKY